MMENETSARKAQIYMIAAHLGAILTVALIAAYQFDLAPIWKSVIGAGLFVIMMVLFRHKMRDEYVERLWNAGTAGAFLLTLAFTLGTLFLHPVHNAISGLRTPYFALSGEVVGLIALAAFFIGFQISRWKSA